MRASVCSIIRCGDGSGGGLELLIVGSVDELGPQWDAVFDAGAGLQTSRAWLGASASAALPAGAKAQFVAISDPEGPLALFAMVEGPGRAWTSLTTPYTCLYQPLLRPGADPSPAFAAFARHCRRRPVTRLEALDQDWAGLAALETGLTQAGLVVRRFEHFANWHENVPHGGWSSYLAGRPGALRETIRRKVRAAERDGARIEIVRDRDALKAALDAYEQVYARSWKDPEPFAGFNGELVARLAASGSLRIALLWQGETPIAAQYWTVNGSTATVLKLAHDDEYKKLSPGTVLTAAAIRHLFETDGITELDFGRGDDAYKRAWTSARRTRIGVIAINWRHPMGLGPLLRHDGGRWIRTLRNFAQMLPPSTCC